MIKKLTLLMLVVAAILGGGMHSAQAGEGCCCKEGTPDVYWDEDGNCE